MNRRDILTAAPAVLVAGAAPAVAMTETPLRRLFTEWQALHSREKALYEASDDFCDDPDCQEATARLLAVEDAMLEIPAADASEWLLKLWAVTEGGDFAMDRARSADLWAEARALVEGRA